MCKQTIKKIFLKIKQYWRLIVELLGIIGILIAFLDLKLQQDQFIFEQLQEPVLEYSYTIGIDEIKLGDVANIVNQLTQEYYELVYAYKEENPNLDYLSAATAVLPITAAIPTEPIVLIVNINNSGNATSNKVRVALELNRPITSVKIDSIEPYTITHGGIGENTVMIEIDRIVSGYSASIEITSELAQSDSQYDKLIMYNHQAVIYELPESNIFKDSYEDLGGAEVLGDPLTGVISAYPDMFPRVYYISSVAPSVEIIVTSAEGPGTHIFSEP